jgi:stage II sporulation protein D
LTAVRGALRVTQPGQAAREVSSPLSLAVATDHGTAVFNGRRYRGELSVAAADSTVRVINRVDLESYLRGVVPRELGVRGAADRAALEAQAVAARSYAITRLGNRSRTYDLSATTSDQVYGGVDAENAVADAAVAATNGLVLSYDGRIVSAPYHSTCGGTTAEPTELWRSRAEPFLQRVSDKIPGTDRYYCDLAPRFRWERTWRADTLTTIVERYLRSYAEVPPSPIGGVRGVSTEGRTPSGRATAVVIETEHGRYRLQGNDVRYVLRSPGGELLNSTYFSPEVVPGSAGGLARLTIRGFGYGHGVGMCQWGAIGRARAGQDFRTILRTYFPGTTVARAY